jgi:hypothetical protein
MPNGTVSENSFLSGIDQVAFTPCAFLMIVKVCSYRHEGEIMSNDSKLGLLAGVAGVLLIAVVYHQKETNAAVPQPEAVKNQPVRANIGPLHLRVAANTPVLDEPR